ncbi:MFS transporter [bacterium]|nr:MFS transporter [bacterium]
MATATLHPVPAGAGARWLRRQIEYGWLTILVGAAAMAATYPGRTHGLGMVTEPLLADLNLADPDGRVFYASLNLWGTLLGALFCLPVGWLLDRYGPRRVLAGNLILLGAAVWWMSGVASWPAFLAGLVLTRGLGQSALSVVSITVVAKAFPAARLGLAMAWYSILSAPFHLLLIRGVGWALGPGGFDWRTVWAGVGVALVGLSAMAVLLSRLPAARPNAPAREPEGGATLGQALATPAFWAFSLTISLWGMIYAGVALFNEDIFRERGFSRELYFDVLSMVTVVALVSKLAFGWLTRYVPLSKLLGVCLLTTALSLAGLPRAAEVWHVYLYGVAMGVASGAVALLFFATWGKLYGRRELGRIQGVAQMLTVLASAAGPLLFAVGRRWAGGYTDVFFTLAAAVLVMAVAVWFVPVPAYTPTPEEDGR